MTLFIFYLSIPFFIRFGFFRFSKKKAIGFLQDCFVLLQLFLLFPISPHLFAAAGWLFHLYLLFDFMLMRGLHLHIRWGVLWNFRNIPSLISSAREMGFYRYISIATGASALHIFFLNAGTFAFSWLYIPALFFTGLLIWILPPSTYEESNPLFQDQIHFWKIRTKRKSAAPRFPTRFEFKGRKLLDVADTPHIVFLFLESLGQSVVDARTTPQFLRLQNEGIYFSNFYANGTLTYRAMLASLFGIPAASQADGLKRYCKMPLKGLPEILKRKGYTTAFFQAGSLGFDHQRTFLHNRYDEIGDCQNLGGLPPFQWGIHDAHLMRHAARWLQNQKNPSFLTLFTITNHHPWILPHGYSAPSFGHPPSASKERFLKTVHYTDHCLGSFIDQLREKKLDSRTILFILGDHGQPMGEHHNNFYNSRFIYEENVRVPLLVLADGRIQEPKKITALGSQIDLLPTVIDLLNLDAKCPHLGTSLLRPEQPRTVFFQNPYSEGFMGCRKGDWKWAQGELFHLGEDPEEKMDRSREFPELARAMEKEAKQYFASVDAFYENLFYSTEKQSAYELDLSNYLISDSECISRISPHLRKVCLNHCLLLTDRSITELLSKCRDLEVLELKGVSDLTDQVFQSQSTLKLKEIDLSGAHRITDAGCRVLAASCPRLRALSLQGEGLTDWGLAALGPDLFRFKLSDAHLISESGILKFFENNKHLARIVFERCSGLTDRVIFGLASHPLEQLWILGKSSISEEGISFLKGLEIRSLYIEEFQILKEWSASAALPLLIYSLP